MSDNNSTHDQYDDNGIDDSPRPFRRERNLSNRNFAKRNSRRRISAESHSSIESQSISNHNTTTAAPTTTKPTTTPTTTPTTKPSTPILSTCSSSASSLQFSYSVNSDAENAFNRRSVLKMLPPQQQQQNDETITSPLDPAMLDVKQKVERFEHLKIEERFDVKNSTKIGTRMIKVTTEGQPNLSPLRVLPVMNRFRRLGSDEPQSMHHSIINNDCNNTTLSSSNSFHNSIDEERSEDEIEDISEDNETGNEYVLPEEAEELQEHTVPSPLPGYEDNESGVVAAQVHEFGIDDFGKVEAVRLIVPPVVSPKIKVSKMTSLSSAAAEQNQNAKKDFKRNYRTTPRPKTEIISTANRPVIGKFNSLQLGSKDDSTSLSLQLGIDDVDNEDEPELRNKSVKVIQPILEELIKTEETYVENLLSGIANYGNIFQRRDLPVGLRGKKYVLLGNIEQLAEFHRDEFLPMLQRNRHNLKRLFDEFQHFIDQHCFYGYVIFTMNKQRSLKLCDVYKNYFKLIQTELDDKLGINSFLVQPIQRMARYPLLMQQFITTLFKNREFVMKPLIESCCRLEKKLRTLLTTTNESEVINDIVDCNEFNVFYQGKFRKVSDFNIFDHTLKRNYRGKVFIFDKCIIYTEIKGKNLVFHGRYPCEHIGIVAKTKNFTLFYERRKQQECDFNGDPMLIEQWLELIRDMINTFVAEEKQKLQERYSRENDHLHRKPPSLSLFRDSNRFSSDSGIGNIWVMPKPEANEEFVNNRTTWYAT